MTLPWSLRVALSMLLLRTSKALAGALRMFPSGPPGGLLPAALPGDDAERAARVRTQAEVLKLVQIGAKYGFADSFDHLTLAELPIDQHYATRMRLPKLVLAAALSVDLRTGAPDTRPDTGAWLGRARGARLHWDEDAAFAPLRLQGPNPAWLRHAPELAVKVGQDPRHAFAVDYRQLLEGLPVREGRFVHPCAALFIADHQGLQSAGLFLEPGGDPRWIPADGTADWARARRYFHCAELHVHEAVSHFLWTHVFGEKLLIATLRRLDERHPVRRLLAPHLVGTLQANENSGRRLLGPDGFFAGCFSAGWTGVAELLRRGDRAWRYRRMVLPRDLEERGVDELSAYPYGEDGLLLWGALSHYVAAVVEAWFADDAAVRADVELAQWSAELHGWLGDRGFPQVTTRVTLAEVLTATLFNVVQHTFVNALQYDAFGDPSVWPAALSAPFESALEGLPVGVEAVDAVRATYGFSIQYNVLGDGLLRWHGERTVNAARELLHELERIQQVIAERETRRPWPYRIALPGNVSNSINA